MYSKDNISPAPAKEFKPPHVLSGMAVDAPILLGLSGGADSTALLHMLSLYAKKGGARLYAAHLNHGIRGKEADRDERFCKELAASLGVEFFSRRVNIPLIASETGESIETAARRVRYEYFASLMKEHGINILATAHNADDNLETILFNLSRGAGLNGLCGIPECRPCEGGTVIRPILGMEKREILEYCVANGLSYVTDSTNTDTDYTRNKIRGEIIPILRQINTGAVKNAYRTSCILKEDSLCLESLADWFTDELGRDGAIELEKLCGSPASVVNRALIRIYSEFSGGKTLETVHIEAIRSLAQSGVPHSSVSLPNGMEALVENKKLYIKKKTPQAKSSLPYSIPLSEGSNFISQTNCEIFIGNSHNAKNIYKKSIQLAIDFDKINGELYAKSRSAGDKIKINGMNKSLKKLMCDLKIPLEIRNRLPVIYDDVGIVAVPFVGIRDGAKLSTANTNTKNIYFYLF